MRRLRRILLTTLTLTSLLLALAMLYLWQRSHRGHDLKMWSPECGTTTRT